MQDFDELRSDVREIKVDVKKISATMQDNTNSLVQHMARTTVAESRLSHLENTHRWFIGLLASSITAILIKLLIH